MIERRAWTVTEKGISHAIELKMSRWPRRQIEISVDGHIQVSARTQGQAAATYPIKVGAMPRYVRVDFFGTHLATPHFHLLESAKAFAYAYDDPGFAWKIHCRFLAISWAIAATATVGLAFGDLAFGFLLVVSLYKIVSSLILAVRAHRAGVPYRDLVEQTEGREWLGGGIRRTRG